MPNVAALKEINKNRFKLNSILSKKSKSNRLELLAKASSIAGKCGIFSSKRIEFELLEIAQKYIINLPQTYEENSFLHVLTQCYNTGGHTRVCERWIKNSPQNQKHSVLLINQEKNIVPQQLIDAISSKNGELIIQNTDDNCIAKALELRKIASNYEKIILHVHMNDIVPIIAFGTLDFKRPIIFFNHADHCFWLGVSIADIVVNLRTYSKDLDIKYRGTLKNFVLPLPIEESQTLKKNNEEIKKTKLELGFDENSKIILSVASSYKYTPFDNYNFVETAKSIINKSKNVYFLIIGPSQNEEYWKEAILSTDRIKVLGQVPNNKIEKYLKIADLAIDSIPLGSFTALLDIAKYNIPCLSLKGPINYLDSFIEANILCENQDDIVQKALEILFQATENKLYKIIRDKHSPAAFSKNLAQLYLHTPKVHSINFFNHVEDFREPIEIELFMAKLNLSIKKNKPSILRKISNRFKEFTKF
jgi:hypothetical protein